MQKNLLGLLGLLPFLLTPAGVWLDYLAVDAGNMLFISYAAVILSFLAGSQWGYALQNAGPRHTPILAVLLSLTGWCAFVASALLALPAAVVLAMTGAGFAGCLWYDHVLYHGLRDYLKLRNVLTTVVLLAHLALYAVQAA